MTRLAAIVFIAFTATAAGAQPSALRPTVLVAGDIVRIGDLVTDVSSEKADIAVFRAPDLGETGSVRVGAVLAALRPHDIVVDAAGLSEVAVTRASRMVGADEIRRRVAEIAGERLRRNAEATISVTFDAPAPTLHLDPAEQGPLMPERLSFDPRSGRFDMIFRTGQSHVRLTGAAYETYDAVVLTRHVARGEVLRPSDLSVEKRPKAEIRADTIRTPAAAVGMVTQQQFRAGQVLRAADLAREQLVKRGDTVVLLYEVPGIVLTARGKAEESGSLGDTVNILNMQSKRVIQGVVSGPGHITVTSLTPRLASAALVKAE